MPHIVGGKFKRRPIFSPKGEEVRPTTAQLRETLFNICQHEIEGALFLDLFAGSGAIGLEALSRGARHVTFVEKGYLAQACIKKNIASLHVEQETTLYSCDVLKALAQFEPESFDLIYVDPPYGLGLGASVLAQIDQRHLLKANGSLFIEEASFHPPPLLHLTLRRQRKSGRALLLEYAYLT